MWHSDFREVERRSTVVEKGEVLIVEINSSKKDEVQVVVNVCVPNRSDLCGKSEDLSEQRILWNII